MKVIFLDFDGVIVHHKYNPSKSNPMEDLDPKCIAQIIRIVDETGAKISIHSTWAYVDPKNKIVLKLYNAGVKPEHLHDDLLCVHPTMVKHEAIRDWLQAHPEVKKWVILDDDYIVPENQIYIRGGMFTGGIQYYHADQAIKMLKE